MATHSSILARIIREQRSLVGYSPCDHRELDMTEQLSMYTHSTRNCDKTGKGDWRF